MKIETPANHLRQQNIPGKPVVEIVYGPNFITAFWKQPPFSEKCDVAFGTDKDHLKALGETKTGLWQFPYAELDPAKEYYVRVQAKNKAGLGPWSDLKTMRVPALETAPPVDTKGKPASVATHWFFRSWGKIRQSTLLPLICMWLIIIGLVYVLIHNAHILDKMRMALIAKSPVIAEVSRVNLSGTSIPPMADVSTARDNRDEKLATSARGGIAMIDSSITINEQISTSINQSWPESEPPQTRCSISDLTTYTDYHGDKITEVCVDPGQDIEYSLPDPEAWCPVVHFTRYLGDRDHLDVAVNGRSWRKNDDGQAPTEKIRTYRFRNRSNQSANMTFRLVPRRH